MVFKIWPDLARTLFLLLIHICKYSLPFAWGPRVSLTFHSYICTIHHLQCSFRLRYLRYGVIFGILEEYQSLSPIFKDPFHFAGTPILPSSLVHGL